MMNIDDQDLDKHFQWITHLEFCITQKLFGCIFGHIDDTS